MVVTFSLNRKGTILVKGCSVHSYLFLMYSRYCVSVVLLHLLSFLTFYLLNFFSRHNIIFLLKAAAQYVSCWCFLNSASMNYMNFFDRLCMNVDVLLICIMEAGGLFFREFSFALAIVFGDSILGLLRDFLYFFHKNHELVCILLMFY